MELQGLVWDILGRYPELHSGFSDFLARCESIDFEFNEAGKGKDGKLSAKEMQKQKVISAREKFLSRPISELDLSACERCGPSYRLLPKNFPKAPASARTPLCHEHLNDNWVSVTSGSEDFSFKAMRKNQYEEALFRCEDDRFELDMVLETTKVTMEALEPIIEKINGMTPEESSHFRIPEGTLTPVHLRAIERLYGIGTDHGQDICRMILDYPAATAHVVMGRLRQKDVEWRRVKVEVAPIWVDVYEKNYNKSLDHRSFYFKQTDKKALSTKGMTGEIKEVSDKKKSSDEAIGSGGAGAMGLHGMSPDLTFAYADRKVHDDVYAILKFSTHEMMNADHAERVMKMWREFCEPFFGISRADTEGDYLDNSAEQAAAFVRKDDEDGEDNDGRGDRDGGGDRGHGKGSLKDGNGNGISNGSKGGRGSDNVKDKAAANRNGSHEDGGGGGDEGGFEVGKLMMDVDDKDTNDDAADLHGAKHANSGNSSSSDDRDGDDVAGAARSNKKELKERVAGAVVDDEKDDDNGHNTAKKRKAAGKAAAAKSAKKIKKLEGSDEDEGEEGHHEEGHEQQEEEEEENGDDSDSNDAVERAYAPCKPLSGMTPHQTLALQGDNNVDTIAAAPLSKLDGKIFYGHDGYYILFRLHQHLYERLATARSSAVSMSKYFGQKAEPEEVRAAKEREIHNDFLRLLFKLLNGAVESSSFEDDCRTLLGANSYVLFTLDKLIYKVVKQIQSLTSDETAIGLLHLSEYEVARSAPFTEAIYHANASVLLLDELCYRFGSVDAGERLTLQLMETGLDKADSPAGTMEAQFHDYLEGFLQTSVDEEGGDDGAGAARAGSRTWMDFSDRPSVFLRRSKIIAGLDATAAAAAEGRSGRGGLAAAAAECLGTVCVFNSLECKISCSNSKVSYVLDTEDVFHRSPGSRAGHGKSRGSEGKSATETKEDKGCARFRTWLAVKEAQMPKDEEKKPVRNAAAEREAVAAAASATDVVAVAAAADDAADDDDVDANVDDDANAYTTAVVATAAVLTEVEVDEGEEGDKDHDHEMAAEDEDEQIDLEDDDHGDHEEIAEEEGEGDEEEEEED
mmetsp:Transcript_16182/g.39442  ORF Transcript_16182/g.39442 Transcript_16182/m.39442 type:complete len:1081 (+) Transcript_16182:583-3825(+)